MTPFSIRFARGTLEGGNPAGAEMAGGHFRTPDGQPLRAYLTLSNMRGVGGGQVTRPGKILRGRFPWIRIPVWPLRFVGMQVTLDGIWIYQAPPVSQHPAPGAQPDDTQVQVYDGTAILSWDRTEVLRWFIWPIRQRGGSARIRGRITLRYPPQLQAQISGTATGTMQLPSLFLGADIGFTASFRSWVPARPYEWESQFIVEDFTLEGNWVD